MSASIFVLLLAVTVAPADDLGQKDGRTVEIVPIAPDGYRRPAGWQPKAPWSKSLVEIARDHSAEVMARAAAQMKKVDEANAAGPFKATGESLDTHRCPEWFVDAKLGIFIDWGPWSVASWCPYVKGARLYPDWYELRCRPDYDGSANTSAVAYHQKNWGKDFMCDHFLDLFRGEKFDAPALMKFFRDCGAKYVVPFLKHHGGFCLWNCSYTFRDTVDMGAHRDFAREIADACRANGLKFGFYDSQATEWEYPILQQDGSIRISKESKPELEPYSSDMEWKCSGKVAVEDFVRDYIVPQATEFIDKYDPDIFWGDYDWVTPADRNGTYDIAAYLYNRAAGRKEVAMNDRYGCGTPEEIARYGRLRHRLIGLRTIRGDFYTDESGDTAADIDPAKWHPWESCSGISKSYGNHWMEAFDKSMVLSEREFLVHFADIVARGGNLLLLVNLDPQGEMPSVQRERLQQIGGWLRANGEAIYGTRICAPYKTDDVDYTQSKDGMSTYAIVKNPSSELTLGCAMSVGSRVTELVSGRTLEVVRDGTAVRVRLPADLASAKLPFVLKCSCSRVVLPEKYHRDPGAEFALVLVTDLAEPTKALQAFADGYGDAVFVCAKGGDRAALIKEVCENYRVFRFPRGRIDLASSDLAKPEAKKCLENYIRWGRYQVEPPALTRYGARVYRKIRGMTGTAPVVKLPENWRFVDGDDGATGCDSRLYYFTIEADGRNIPPPVISVSWPGVEISSVDGATNVMFTADGVVLTPIGASGGANYLTMVQDGALGLALHHHVEGAQHGPYGGKPLPWAEIRASDNWRAAAREMFKAADLATPNRTEGANINLYGFDSNFPNRHVDHPTHFHVMLEWGDFTTNSVGHYTLDPRGFIRGNNLLTSNVPGCDRNGYHFQKLGERTDYRGPSGRTVFSLAMLADGTGLILRKPGCAWEWKIASSRPDRSVSVFEKAGGGWGLLAVLSVEDDTVRGVYRIIKTNEQGRSDEEFRYNPDTGRVL